MNNGILPLTLAAFCIIGMSAANAATAIGRVTYMDAGKRELMLDNIKMFSAAPNVDLESVFVAEQVSLTFSTRNGQDLVSAIRKVPQSGAPQKR